MDERYHALLEKVWHCSIISEKCAAACLASDRIGHMHSPQLGLCRDMHAIGTFGKTAVGTRAVVTSYL